MGKHRRRFLTVLLALFFVTLVMQIMDTDNLALATPTTYTLSVRTWNQYAMGHWAHFRGVNFTIDDENYTSFIDLSLPEGLYTIEMPLKWSGDSHYSGYGQYTFIRWEDFNDPRRSYDRILTIDLTANMTINAVYQLYQWELTVNSDPISGINFTRFDEVGEGSLYMYLLSTPWHSFFISEGYHTIAMSSNWTVDSNFYNFVHWEDDSTESTRTIFVTEDTTITATYEPDTTPPSISGMELEPSIPEPGEQVTVTANVTDELSGVTETTIFYRLNEGEWKSISMSRTVDVWNATIPAQESGVNVDYYIEVVDNAGNKGESSTYSYTVTNTSFIGGPGWTDEIVVFGGIGTIATIGLFLILKRKKH